MKTAKNEIRNFCTKFNFNQPKFSGKTKTMYCHWNVNYTIQQHLINFSTMLGYKIVFK